MNDTLSTITKLRIAGMLSDSAHREVEQKLMAITSQTANEVGIPRDSN
ncbi:MULTISPECIES: hypothetical protein [Aequorivita]|uniref:Uncharacterized protein n=2 Tax=Aequorivita TaxID=153265 RepID=A0AB35YVM8_9FLAO|nr:hypothetical protein [Aequorivita sp. Ant34-E75]WGF92493.1 hypothetical protein QCQ61_14965 [Aequorivita sp. Ant34-E75]